MSKAEDKMWESGKLNRVVLEFSEKMKERVHEKLDEGYSGWDKNEMYNQIHTMLKKKVNKIGQLNLRNKDFIDIANLAMFLYNLEINE